MNYGEKIKEVEEKLSELSAIHGEEVAAAYSKGFDDGKASMGNGDEKLYSQAELDAIVTPLKEEVAALTAKVEQMGKDQEAAISAAVAAAVTKLKADLKAAYEAEQASETESEKRFADLLKTEEAPAPVEPAPSEPVQE